MYPFKHGCSGIRVVCFDVHRVFSALTHRICVFRKLLRINSNYSLYWLIFKWRRDVFCKVGNECSISRLKELMETIRS